MSEPKISYALAALLIVAAFFVIYTNNSSNDYKDEAKELKQANLQLRNKLNTAELKLDSLNKIIKIANEDYLDLLVSKSKTKTIYETKFKEFANPAIVSNDSVTKYISSKIYSRR